MVRELHLKTEILPGGRIEVTDTDLPVGQTVEIVVRSSEASDRHLSNAPDDPEASEEQSSRDRQEADRKLDIDEFWPVHPTVVWPEGLSLRREDIYQDRA